MRGGPEYCGQGRPGRGSRNGQRISTGGNHARYATICRSSRLGITVDTRRLRIFSGLAEIVIVLAAAFLLLDAVLGFTGNQRLRSAQLQPMSQYADSTNLSTSCAGGFANKRTVDGTTQVAPHGTPFNAYEVTLTNIGITAFTVYSLTVDLADSRDQVFARHSSGLGDGAGVTLRPGQSRRVIEAYGIRRPVASCEVLSWRS